MSDTSWIEAVEYWRSLPAEEKQRRRLEAIPRHVANSMAMEGEPVDEEWIREYLAPHIRHSVTTKCSLEPDRCLEVASGKRPLQNHTNN